MDKAVMPVKGYLAVFAALLALTAVTTGIAFVDLGPYNSALALAVAITKASLVILYFMHVRFASRLIGLYATGGVLWLLILLSLTMSDVVTRGQVTLPER